MLCLQCQPGWCEVLTPELQLGTSLCSVPGSTSVLLWLFALLCICSFSALVALKLVVWGFFSLSTVALLAKETYQPFVHHFFFSFHGKYL